MKLEARRDGERNSPFVMPGLDQSAQADMRRRGIHGRGQCAASAMDPRVKPEGDR